MNFKKFILKIVRVIISVCLSLMVRGPQQSSHRTHRSRDKRKTLYRYFHKECGHKLCLYFDFG